MVVILSAARTPIGAFQGAIASLSAPQLGAAAIRAAVERSGVQPSCIEEVLMGNVLQAGLGQAPARQAALGAGLSQETRAVTVHKVCGSGLQSILQGMHLIRAGEARWVVAGGMESMSNAPYLLPKARQGFRLGHQTVIDSVVHDALWDPYQDLHMGNCAEACASRYQFTREQQDAFAIASYQRANEAVCQGAFSWEITPLEIPDARRGAIRVENDEGPSRVNYDKIPTLRPAFDKDGTITAANASSLNDGAAAVVLSSETAAKEQGLQPLARIVSFGCHAQEPLWFTTAPINAVRIALSRAGWATADVDLWEINEAFAVVPMALMQELGVSHDRVNVRGGAIALGHPVGASGTRILVALLGALRDRGLRRGVAALCIGGGEGFAICVERLDS